MRDIYFGPENLKLHGVISHGDAPGSAAAIICHPHPQFGGNMNNNVVLGVEKELVDAGFTAMRFNFRGVGRSAGEFDNGIGEKDDVRWAVDALAADGAVGGIVIVGYSFGAVAALPVAAEDPRVSALAGISPPTVMADFGYLSACAKPKLLIAGSADDFCDHKKIKPLASGPNDSFELLPGVDHFYIGQELRAGGLVCDFVQRLVRDKLIK